MLLLVTDICSHHIHTHFKQCADRLHLLNEG